MGPLRRSCRLVTGKASLGSETCHIDHNHPSRQLDAATTTTMSTDNDSSSASGETESDNNTIGAGTFHITAFCNMNTTVGFRLAGFPGFFVYSRVS